MASAAMLLSTWPCAWAQARVERMAWRSFRACSGRLVHSGVSTRQHVLTAESCRRVCRPRIGKTCLFSPCHHFLATRSLRQRGRFCFVGPLGRLAEG